MSELDEEPDDLTVTEQEGTDEASDTTELDFDPQLLPPPDAGEMEDSSELELPELVTEPDDNGDTDDEKGPAKFDLTFGLTAFPEASPSKPTTGGALDAQSSDDEGPVEPFTQTSDKLHDTDLEGAEDHAEHVELGDFLDSRVEPHEASLTVTPWSVSRLLPANEYAGLAIESGHAVAAHDDLVWIYSGEQVHLQPGDRANCVAVLPDGSAVCATRLGRFACYRPDSTMVWAVTLGDRIKGTSRPRELKMLGLSRQHPSCRLWLLTSGRELYTTAADGDAWLLIDTGGPVVCAATYAEGAVAIVETQRGMRLWASQGESLPLPKAAQAIAAGLSPHLCASRDHWVVSDCHQGLTVGRYSDDSTWRVPELAQVTAVCMGNVHCEPRVFAATHAEVANTADVFMLDPRSRTSVQIGKLHETGLYAGDLKGAPALEIEAMGWDEQGHKLLISGSFGVFSMAKARLNS